MPEAIEAYPLTWPAGWKRTPDHERKRASFGKMKKTEGRSWSNRSQLTISQATQRLLDELERLGAENVVISSDLRLRLDGLPRSSQRTPDDPGIAVYFNLDGQPHCMPCDRWDRIADNLAAVAKQVEAIRGMDRWGCGNTRVAFAGFKALPPMSTERPWWEVLGCSRDTHRADVKETYLRLAQEHHPDRGGDEGTMAAITGAYQRFKEQDDG